MTSTKRALNIAALAVMLTAMALLSSGCTLTIGHVWNGGGFHGF